MRFIIALVITAAASLLASCVADGTCTCVDGLQRDCPCGGGGMGIQHG
jgi:hypothetical protein